MYRYRGIPGVISLQHTGSKKLHTESLKTRKYFLSQAGNMCSPKVNTNLFLIKALTKKVVVFRTGGSHVGRDQANDQVTVAHLSFVFQSQLIDEHYHTKTVPIPHHTVWALASNVTSNVETGFLFVCIASSEHPQDLQQGIAHQV